MHQAFLSMEFSRQEYWRGLPCLPPGDFSDSGIEPRFPALPADSFPSEPPGKCSRIFKKYLFIYLFLFLAVLGLHCCMRFYPVEASTGYSSSGVKASRLPWLLLLQSTRSKVNGLSSCGSQTLETWD